MYTVGRSLWSRGMPSRTLATIPTIWPWRLVVRDAAWEHDDPVAERVASGPVAARHGLIDDRDGGCHGSITVSQSAYLHDRDVECIEIVRRDDAIAHEYRRCLVERLIDDAEARAPVGLHQLTNNRPSARAER